MNPTLVPYLFSDGALQHEQMNFSPYNFYQINFPKRLYEYHCFRKTVEENKKKEESESPLSDPDLVVEMTGDYKPRLRWTADLHQRFVNAVNELGGPFKAKPKAIFNAMNVKGITLFQLKSHLQKYRLGNYSNWKLQGVKKRLKKTNLHPEGSGPSSLGASNVYGYESKHLFQPTTADMGNENKWIQESEAEKGMEIWQDQQKNISDMMDLDETFPLISDEDIVAFFAGFDFGKEPTSRPPPPTNVGGHWGFYHSTVINTDATKVNSANPKQQELTSSGFSNNSSVPFGFSQGSITQEPCNSRASEDEGDEELFSKYLNLDMFSNESS